MISLAVVSESLKICNGGLGHWETKHIVRIAAGPQLFRRHCMLEHIQRITQKPVHLARMPTFTPTDKFFYTKLC